MLRVPAMDAQQQTQQLHISTDDMVSLTTPLLPPSLAYAFNVPLQNRSSSTGDGSGSTNPSITPFSVAGLMTMPQSFAQAPYYAYPGALMPGACYGVQDPSMLFSAAHFAGLPMGAMYRPFDYATALPMSAAPTDAQPPSMLPLDDDDPHARKRPRLVWTGDLHKRFVTAIRQLGDEKAVPTAIMKKMNVDGLTRENVASHLQKYRLQQQRKNTDDEGSCEIQGFTEGKSGAAVPLSRTVNRRKRKASKLSGGMPGRTEGTEGLGSTSRLQEQGECSEGTAGSASGGAVM